MRDNVDIIIVGAGVAGLSLSLILAKEGFKVALLDKNEIKANLNSNMDIALNHTSRNILVNLGVWDSVKCSAASYTKMLVMHQENDSLLDFTAEELGYKNLGYIADLNLVKKILIDKVTLEKNIILFPNEELLELVYDQKVTVVTKNKTYIFAELLIGADGGNSTVRRLCDIEVRKKDYTQGAIVARVHHTNEHSKTAWQTFLSNGVLAMLPLLDQNMSSIVYSADNYKEILENGSSCLEKDLYNKTEGEYGNITIESDLRYHPLYKVGASKYGAKGCILVADAAHMIHPLAGQGINLGFLDIAVLAESIKKSQRRYNIICFNKILSEYQRQRYMHNLLMLEFTDKIKMFYSRELSPMNYIREKAVALVNKNTFVKKQLVNVALGYLGQVPELCQTLEHQYDN